MTCDELLRGERKPPAARAEAAEPSEIAPKAEKQRQRLLKLTLSQYKNRTCIAMGVSVTGVIAALICDLAFLKAVLGFFLGAIFFAASIVCQAVFINKAFFSVEDAGLEENVRSGFKGSVIRLAERSIGLTAAFLGFARPRCFWQMPIWVLPLTACFFGEAWEPPDSCWSMRSCCIFCMRRFCERAYMRCPKKKLPFIMGTTS